LLSSNAFYRDLAARLESTLSFESAMTGKPSIKLQRVFREWDLPGFHR
jgi:hypothetical protein